MKSYGLGTFHVIEKERKRGTCYYNRFLEYMEEASRRGGKAGRERGMEGSEEENGRECMGWAATDPSGLLSPFKFYRRNPGPHDIVYRVTHCGVCYAELLWTRNLLGTTKYPIVPGHEVVGIVTEIGSNVSRFQVGDRVGTGNLVNSCRQCEYCHDNLENYCAKVPVLTYDAIDFDGSVTRGGLSSFMVADERYCFKIPDSLPLELAAPLLCAGITVYSPMMRHCANKPGKALGVLGLGGLGHIAVKFGKAFGLNVTVLSTSPSKKEEALTVLGADKFLVTSEKAEIEGAAKTLDFIIDTASASHPLDLYLPLLKTGGVLIIVGAAPELKFTPALLFLGMRSIVGSVSGGIKDTQDMLEFCAKHNIVPIIETIPIQYINTALERLQNNDVRYRFVVNVEQSLRSD